MNVHPAKIEVRFVNERPVFELVYYGVKSAIETLDTPVEAKFKTKTQPMQTTVNGKLDFFTPKPEATQIKFRQESADDFWRVAAPSHTPDKAECADDKLSAIPESNYKISLSELEKENNLGTAEPMQKFTSPASQIIKEEKAEPDDDSSAHREPLMNKEPIEEINFRLIGEAFKTYIIIEMDGAMYMIDKHAAHERMNFEQLKASSQVSSQVLLSPVAVRLSGDEYNAVVNNLELYAKCGFSVEDFGSSTVLVRECPSILDGEDVKGLIEETASKLLDGKTDITPDKADWIFHSASCRAADKTSPYEMELFVKKLLSNPNIRYCPHGRPVMIKITKYDIEKQFGRIQ